MMLRRKMVILMADDDEDDRLLAQDALLECGENAELRFVGDGVELIDYLHESAAFEAKIAQDKTAQDKTAQDQADKGEDTSSISPEPIVNPKPRPDLILLDLNMPRLDGREALRQIKLNPALRRTPIVILTTSRAEEDVWRAYDEGANSYVAKPVSFEGLVDVMKNLRSYWAETVQLPADGKS
jgi:two-component system response regulator